MRKKWQSKRNLRAQIAELEDKLANQVPVNVHLPVNEQQQFKAVMNAHRGQWMRAQYSFKLHENGSVEFSEMGIFQRGAGR